MLHIIIYGLCKSAQKKKLKLRNTVNVEEEPNTTNIYSM
jgi:hypothetical protein